MNTKAVSYYTVSNYEYITYGRIPPDEIDVVVKKMVMIMLVRSPLESTNVKVQLINTQGITAEKYTASDK